MEQTLFHTSTGFDSLLAFDLETEQYVWGFHLQRPYDEWGGHTFDPRSNRGPRPVNAFHINMVHVDQTGIYFSGLHTHALLHLNSRMQVSEVCSLPSGAHNARPYRDGLLFNDTESDCVRYAGQDGSNVAFRIETYDPNEIEFAGVDDSRVARQGFGRGLCPVGESFVAGGSSPSTVSLYDLDRNQKVGSVNLTMDIRNAIHGLELWPFDDWARPSESFICRRVHRPCRPAGSDTEVCGRMGVPSKNLLRRNSRRGRYRCRCRSTSPRSPCRHPGRCQNRGR